MAYLEVRQLTKTYPGDSGAPVHAIDHINFDVDEGEFVCILGPSGCGKTTLLRSIAGLETVSTGSITLNGQTVTEPGPELGVVYQEHRLFPWLTVQDNVEYGLARKGVSKADRRRISEMYLDMVGLNGFARQYPKSLSIGMSQRVGIARALAPDPHILLMDEPFASVDAQTRRELQHELLRIWQETEKTVLFVTHSVDEAVALASRIIVLSPRPSRIADIIPVDLPYPRDETDPTFNDIKREVLGLLLV